MRIRTLRSVGIAVSALAIVVFASTLYVLDESRQRSLARNEDAAAIIDVVFARNLALQDYLLHGGPRAERQLRDAQGHLGRLYRERPRDDPDGGDELARMRSNYEQTNAILADLFRVRARESTREADARLEGRLLGRLLVLSQDTVAVASRLAERARADLARSITLAGAWGGGVGVAVVATLAGTWLYVAGTLLPRLQRLHAGIRELARGNLDHRIGIRGDDEMAQVAQAFDSMARSLSRSSETLRQRTAELEAANAEMDAFVYSVSHDLRAPLRAIDGFSQALVEDYRERLDGDAITYLGYLREGAREMEALIDALLALSRTTRGELDREPVDLSSIACEVVAELRARDADRRVSVDVGQGIEVHGDRRLLRTVLENLIGNAWKFTRDRDDARIALDGERTPLGVHCLVRDNGAGFDAAYVDKLFRPFQRLHTTREFEGTGIGLASVQRIVARHGGRVWAEGAPGEGATFHFEISDGATT